MRTTKYTETSFDTGDTTINVAEWPDNGPPLLFIHGITSDWSTWREIVPAFQADWHCYAVDLRGHGKSGHIPGGYHRDSYASDPIALIQEKIKQPTFIVGHSLGGTTALGVAATIPDLVRAVVYEDPPMFQHEPDRRQTEPAGGRFGRQLELIESGKSVESMAEVLGKRFGLDHTGSIRKARQMMNMAAEVLRASISGAAAANWDVEARLKQASPRALLLTANRELGGVMSEQDTQRAMRLLPNGTAARWDDSGHGMHTSFPERFISTVNKFFREP